MLVEYPYLLYAAHKVKNGGTWLVLMVHQRVPKKIGKIEMDNKKFIYAGEVKRDSEPYKNLESTFGLVHTTAGGNVGFDNGGHNSNSKGIGIYGLFMIKKLTEKVKVKEENLMEYVMSA